MAKDSRGLLLFWGALATCATLVAMPGHAAVGRTAGSFSVSSSGSFNYTIPLFTSPGPNGIQPSVALTYNSNAGPGILGLGWGLVGEVASSIRYCRTSIAQDSYCGGSGKLCLDGNRLRLQSGTYGAGGSVYMTEIADFSRITRNGTSYCNTISYTMERKDGLIYTYGGTSDSQVSCGEWKLSEIRDRNGNKVRFTWKAADSTTSGTTHPVKIEWTQTSVGSGSYVYSMDFIYSAGGNAANSSCCRAKDGLVGFDSDLLTAITVSTSGTVQRKYVLTYDNSPTTAGKRLAQVKECSDSAATDCLSPTNITYQGTTPGFSTSPVSGATAANGEYDLDGDGIKDILHWSSGTWYVQFGRKSGYESAINTGVSSTPLLGGKLNGTSADQLMGELPPILLTPS